MRSNPALGFWKSAGLAVVLEDLRRGHRGFGQHPAADGHHEHQQHVIGGENKEGLLGEPQQVLQDYGAGRRAPLPARRGRRARAPRRPDWFGVAVVVRRAASHIQVEALTKTWSYS